MTPLYAYPIRRLEEITRTAADAIRTLPDGRLRAEREALREQCAGAVGAAPAGLVLAIYDAEISRRGASN